MLAFALVELAELPFGHALQPGVEPRGTVDHVGEGLFQPAPLDELVHDREPVAADAAHLHLQNAVEELGVLLEITLILRRVVRHHRHADHRPRVRVVGDHAVVAPGAELVVRIRGVQLDVHASALDRHAEGAPRLVDGVVLHVLPVPERPAQPLLGLPRPGVLAFDGEKVLVLDPGGVAEQDQRPGALQAVELLPQAALLFHHRQGRDLRVLAGQGLQQRLFLLR